MNDTLNKVYEDTDTLLGFVSFLKELGIINLESPCVPLAAKFYASYKDNIAQEHDYWLALARKEMLVADNGAVPSSYAVRVRHMLAR